MKKLKSDLTLINRQLKMLKKKINVLVEVLGKEMTSMSASEESTLSTNTVEKKSRMSSSTKAVIEMIQKHHQGIDIETLKKETGLEAKQLSNIVHRAFKKGILQRAGRGMYKAA